MSDTTCELCQSAGGEILVRHDRWRVVLVDDVRHPGLCRVIWNAHLREMTDLPPDARAELMEVVWKIERAIRDVLTPDKINLASLGNMVPHLHWHIIPRYEDDAQFPGPIWVESRRVTPPEAIAARMAQLPALRAAIVKRLEQA